MSKYKLIILCNTKNILLQSSTKLVFYGCGVITGSNVEHKHELLLQREVPGKNVLLFIVAFCGILFTPAGGEEIE